MKLHSELNHICFTTPLPIYHAIPNSYGIKVQTGDNEFKCRNLIFKNSIVTDDLLSAYTLITTAEANQEMLVIDVYESELMEINTDGFVKVNCHDLIGGYSVEAFITAYNPPYPPWGGDNPICDLTVL